eukprot:6201133-Pleurochrysis_carterae.AAC.2
MVYYRIAAGKESMEISLDCLRRLLFAGCADCRMVRNYRISHIEIIFVTKVIAVSTCNLWRNRSKSLAFGPPVEVAKHSRNDP